MTTEMIDGREYKIFWAHYRSSRISPYKLTVDGKIEYVYDTKPTTDVIVPINPNYDIIPREAVTVCKIIDAETREVVAFGVAICGPRDNFNKKIGRKISLTRARSALSGKATNFASTTSLEDAFEPVYDLSFDIFGYHLVKKNRNGNWVNSQEMTDLKYV